MCKTLRRPLLGRGNKDSIFSVKAATLAYSELQGSVQGCVKRPLEVFGLRLFLTFETCGFLNLSWWLFNQLVYPNKLSDPGLLCPCPACPSPKLLHCAKGVDEFATGTRTAGTGRRSTYFTHVYCRSAAHKAAQDGTDPAGSGIQVLKTILLASSEFALQSFGLPCDSILLRTHHLQMLQRGSSCLWRSSAWLFVQQLCGLSS